MGLKTNHKSTVRVTWSKQNRRVTVEGSKFSGQIVKKIAASSKREQNYELAANLLRLVANLICNSGELQTFSIIISGPQTAKSLKKLAATLLIFSDENEYGHI